MSHKISLGKRLSASVILIFLIFAASFIIFQQAREKHFKIEAIQSRLQIYNNTLSKTLTLGGTWEQALQLANLDTVRDLRITLIDTTGRVLYDNTIEDYAALPNHLHRPEVADALRHGNGCVIDRFSSSTGRNYFYSATYYRHALVPAQPHATAGGGMVVRSALPYTNDLLRSLSADQHYLWFALAAMGVLAVVLYRFMSRLGDNITKLQLFATRADHGESLDTDDLMEFSNDELGEIAERIIKLYKRLRRTKEEQAIIKRQLTQNIAHELKTPVASIQGYLETILENPQIQPVTRKQFLERSYAQTQRLTSLLQDISTLNRMDDAPQAKEFQPLDLAPLVQNIRRETTLQFAEHRMKLLVDIPPRAELQGNPSLLYSIFRNLIDNAIAYAGQGTTVTLTIRDGGADRTWHCHVADNGAGVPAEHLPRLFERFYRVDKGRSRKMGGTGLGLAIVKNAVLLHGGAITVQNEPQGGLRFSFTLPKR